MLTKCVVKIQKGIQEIRRWWSSNSLQVVTEVVPRGNSGSTILVSLIVGVGLTAMPATVASLSAQSTFSVRKVSMHHGERILQRSLADAAKSPYAIMTSSLSVPELKPCVFRDEECIPTVSNLQPTASPVPFKLFDASGVLLADGTSPIQYDALGRPCETGCKVSFEAEAYYVTSCLDNASTCQVANEIQVNYRLTRVSDEAQSVSAEETANVGAIECGEGFVLTGFVDGEPQCTDLAMALMTPVSNTDTETDGDGVADAGTIPNCSNSTGEIPADRSSRPVRPRAPRGSAEWNTWLNERWYAGPKGGDIKGDHPCQEVAYAWDLHCSRSYESRLSEPGGLVCGDFHDCKNGDCTFLEISPTCDSVKFVGCRASSGCFAAGTQIRLPDGTDRSIELLRVGDVVLNPLSGHAQEIERLVEGPEKAPLMKIDLENQLASITVTSDHPMITQRGLIAAENLRMGDSLLTEQGKFVTVEKVIQAFGYTDYVWNIQLKGDGSLATHAVLANGISTGDLKMQEKLASPGKVATKVEN